jgi:hypothetical protein
VTPEKLLVLTPVKDARAMLNGYFRMLATLTFPAEQISLGLLESDSTDGTYGELAQRMPELEARYRRVRVWKQDFHLRLPPGLHRGTPHVQDARRIVLAKSRNHLLFRALDDEDWVLWLDVDVVEYPPDIVERLIATGKDIVQPNCVLDTGGPSYDQNAWRDRGRLHMDDLKAEGELVELHAVGGTMLLVRADVHREGLVFPTYPYGRENPFIRAGQGEIETEGLGVMARDMGYRCWGMPRLEILHRRW